LESRKRFARGATFVGAIFALVTVFNPLDWAPHIVQWGAAALILGIAIVNLWELISDFDGKTRLHHELYKGFMLLQEEMARGDSAWENLLAEWEAKAIAIRAGEPPTMWAVYAMCWNQVAERHQAERKGYYRQVGLLEYWLANIVQFRPQDFPAHGTTKA
jgi:hypothetical protein